jgi:hypothetical protein
MDLAIHQVKFGSVVYDDLQRLQLINKKLTFSVNVIDKATICTRKEKHLVVKPAQARNTNIIFYSQRTC